MKCLSCNSDSCVRRLGEYSYVLYQCKDCKFLFEPSNNIKELNELREQAWLYFEMLRDKETAITRILLRPRKKS